MQTTHEILVRTKAASRALASVGQADKEHLLLCMADSLLAHEGDILAANARDMAASAGVITPVMADRLLLTDKRIAGMAQGVRDVAHLPDPVGEVLSEVTRPNGMVIRKVRVPFGLIAIIYESRPNVTSDAVALALRSGNACVLRCGKEAHATCLAVMAALKAGIAAAEIPGVSPDCINLLEDTSRASATELMTADGLVDLLIPRGGAGLIRACVENATVPCIQTGTGICHVYVDKSADLDMAVRIMVNAKTSRPSVCNAAECVLVDRAAARDFLPLAWELLQTKGVELRGCPETRAILGDWVKPAAEADWDTEFGDYILAVKVVSGFDEAVDFIASHGTGHSEAIVTADYFAAQRFLDEVDAAAVYVNASTRFTDGFEFGLGAEIGISTQKMHARGPMGLEELTSSKYVIYGTGQVR